MKASCTVGDVDAATPYKRRLPKRMIEAGIEAYEDYRSQEWLLPDRGVEMIYLAMTEALPK